MAKTFLFLSLIAFATNYSFASEKKFRPLADSAIAQLKKGNTDFTIKIASFGLDQALRENSKFGSIKFNFILGYAENSQGNFGKAAIHYLDAIRWSENLNGGSYETEISDIIGVHESLGNIYEKFNHFEQAQKHYDIAMEVASSNGDSEEFAWILYNSSLMRQRQGEYELGLKQLMTLYKSFSELSNEQIANVYSLTGYLLIDLEKFDEAISTYQKLIRFVDGKEDLKSSITGRALHNIGYAHFKNNDFEKAVHFYRQAQLIRKDLNDKPGYFITSKELGESYFQLGILDSAKVSLKEAETVLSSGKSHEDYYELYKILANISKSESDYAQASYYQDLYTTRLEEYLEEQRTIEEHDKQYNLDLITQRYFALVAEQKRNDQIKQYSIMGVSVLVSVILIILGYIQYRKYALRRELERELRPLTEDL